MWLVPVQPTMSKLPHGVYHIINVKSKTFLDLSGSDPTHTASMSFVSGMVLI